METGEAKPSFQWEIVHPSLCLDNPDTEAGLVHFRTYLDKSYAVKRPENDKEMDEATLGVLEKRNEELLQFVSESGQGFIFR